MKLDTSDISDLQPIIAQAVHATIEEIRTAEAKLGGERLGYPEREAAELLGVAGHILRDARLRGEIKAKMVGKRYIYSRTALVEFLSAK